MQKIQPPSGPTTTQEPNRFQRLFRYVPSGMSFARFKLRGKQVRKCLGTPDLTPARGKLIELRHNEMAIAHERRQEDAVWRGVALRP